MDLASKKGILGNIKMCFDSSKIVLRFGFEELDLQEGFDTIHNLQIDGL